MMYIMISGGVTPRLSASSYRGDLSGVAARALRGRPGAQASMPGAIA